LFSIPGYGEIKDRLIRTTLDDVEPARLTITLGEQQKKKERASYGVLIVTAAMCGTTEPRAAMAAKYFIFSMGKGNSKLLRQQALLR
jgi:hypothetical protein